MPKITTFLTFERGGKEAIELYCSIFENSTLHHMMVMPGGDQLLHAAFSLDGQEFMAMDGGEEFTFGLGTSLFVNCADQAEVDRYWDSLTATGGEPGQCGWLKDRFGVSWQIIPEILGVLMSGPDPARSMRVRDAMFTMGKLDVAGLQRAYDEGG
jgi:predicted 3-demethylubiquinone-9 3-methyltransferase (glyoxalase superfamily)